MVDLDFPATETIAAAKPRTVALVAKRFAEARAELCEIIRSFDPDAFIIDTPSGRRVLDAFTSPADAHQRPTISFVSVQLDGISGAEAIAMVKATGETIPSLVLLSDRPVPKWTEVCKHLDAYEFLLAPFDRSHILKLLEADRRRRVPTRVLLVDSSGQSRGLVTRTMDSSGFSLIVEETDSGRQALRLLNAKTYDLVLIDFALQGMDCLEVACQANDLEGCPPLMMMTSGNAESLALASRHFGVSFVLRKPFYARDIDLAMHHVLGLRRPYLLNALVAANPGVVHVSKQDGPVSIRA